MSKTLEELTAIVVKNMRAYQATGTKAWDYDITARDLSCQLGSLMRLLMQFRNERYREGQTDEQLKLKIGDELADILTDVLFIAHELKIDLNKAFEGMLANDAEKIEARKTS